MKVIYKGHAYRLLRFGRVIQADGAGRYKPAADAATTKVIIAKLTELGMKRQLWSDRNRAPYDLASLEVAHGAVIDLDQQGSSARAKRAKATTPTSWERAPRGARRTTLSALQIAIRDADRIWGPQLVDVAIAAAGLREAGDEKSAAVTIAGLRESRRQQIGRLSKQLLAIAKNQAKTR